MSQISAFVGYSFIEDDKEVVGKFLQHFDRLQGLGIGFTWDHAEPAEPKILSQKVREKMMDKNLFIGICTKREHAVVPSHLKQNFMSKNTFTVKKENLQWKTSDWILQEIGFAIAKDMKIMLLLEEGLRKPGGLQGDLEYVPFNRQTPQSCFDKILEMLGSMRPKPGTTVVELATSEEPAPEASEEKKPEPSLAEREPDDSWGWAEYHRALFWAILNNDTGRAKHISESYLTKISDKDEYMSISWRAQGLEMRHDLRNENVIEELRTLQTQHPTHSLLATVLARIYRKYDHRQAAKYFLVAAEHRKNTGQKIKDLCDAAISAAADEDENLVRNTIEHAKELKSTVDDDATIMDALAQISDIKKDIDSYLAFNEGAIAIRPEDQQGRSSLAYKYFDTKEHDLALYHFRIVVNDKPEDSTAWNNLGVAASRLSLESRAVEAYRCAEQLGNTLAMSNLANKLIGSGFLKDADQLCQKAIKIENYDHRIGNAIAHITKVREEEGNKEKSLILATNTRRSFYIEYAYACLDKLAGTLPKKWKGEDCELTVTISEGVLEATGSFKQELEFRFLGPLSQLSHDDGELVNVRWTAVLLGRGAIFNSSRNSDKRQGIMVISQDLRRIKLYEKEDEGKGKFYEWERVENSNLVA